LIRAFIVLWSFRSKYQGKDSTSEGRENQKSSEDESDDELLTSLLTYVFICFLLLLLLPLYRYHFYMTLNMLFV